jgi:hypothetical protein
MNKMSEALEMKVGGGEYNNGGDDKDELNNEAETITAEDWWCMMIRHGPIPLTLVFE